MNGPTAHTHLHAWAQGRYAGSAVSSAASYLSRPGRWLIEFVPQSDCQVRRLLLSRPDIFPSYTKEGFEKALRSGR